MKSNPITKRASASPFKLVGDEKSASSKSSSSSTSYEADASGNVFKVDRTSSAGDMISNASQPSSNVPAARGGTRATDAGKYVEGLKKRFPNATGEDLKSKGYISDAYVNQFPSAQASSSSNSTESSQSETKTPVMRPAEPGNKGMETDTRWAWQQRNINRTQNAQERQNRREARKDMKYLESEGLVQRTGKLGRGQGWELTEAGSADQNAQAMFKANKRDIFGADRQRFRTDENGNVTGRSEAYDVQDSRKNRAQTGSYDPNDNYKAAKPEEQWNVNKHGAYGSTTTSSSSSSDNRSSSSSMFNADSAGPQENGVDVPSKGMANIPSESTVSGRVAIQDNSGLPVSEANVPSKGMSDLPGEPLPRNGASSNVQKQSGIPSEGSRTMPSDYEPDFSEKPILGSESSYQMANAIQGGLGTGARESGPTPSYKSRGNMEEVKEETPLQMKYKHNPRMMYGNSPAKMWGAEKVQAQTKIVGDFRSETAGKPITKAASGPFKMRGYKK
jgi:hypothetical protein